MSNGGETTKTECGCWTIVIIKCVCFGSTAPASKPVITDAKGIEMRNVSGLYDRGTSLTLICTVTQGTFFHPSIQQANQKRENIDWSIVLFHALLFRYEWKGNTNRFFTLAVFV